MSAHTGHSHSTPHTPKPGTRTTAGPNQGGRPMTMVVGMATVAAGLGAFWMLQFRTQNRNPAEMSTWQHRRAQQTFEASDKVNGPGGSAKTIIQDSEGAQQRMRDMISDEGPTVETATQEGGSGSLQTRDRRHGKGILAYILGMIHGVPKDTDESGHVGQPAPIRRLNDRSGVYTKNSDYKDSHRRE